MLKMPMMPKYFWGSNSRAESACAKLLGWKAAALGFWDEWQGDVKFAFEDREHHGGLY